MNHRSGSILAGNRDERAVIKKFTDASIVPTRLLAPPVRLQEEIKRNIRLGDFLVSLPLYGFFIETGPSQMDRRVFGIGLDAGQSLVGHSYVYSDVGDFETGATVRASRIKKRKLVRGLSFSMVKVIFMLGWMKNGDKMEFNFRILNFFFFFA